MVEQSKLFPDVTSFTTYEQPLNERIRSCLRLEHLFAAYEQGLQGGSDWDSREALNAMIEIGDLVSRSDIKGELIKELERFQLKLGALRSNPAVDQQALEETVASFTPIVSTLKQSNCQPGSTLRNDELINQFRQRISIAGGTCNFDLPAFHFWLQKDQDERAAQIRKWSADLGIVAQAIQQILTLLRESASSRRVVASEGFYQHQLDPNFQCQLVRVFVGEEVDAFPEISGGKHRFTVRFLSQPDTQQRPEQVSGNIDFEIQCCGF